MSADVLYELTRLQILQTAMSAAAAQCRPFEEAYLHAWNHRLYPVLHVRRRDEAMMESFDVDSDVTGYDVDAIDMSAVRRVLERSRASGKTLGIKDFDDTDRREGGFGVSALSQILRYFYLSSKTQEEINWYVDLEKAFGISRFSSVSFTTAFEGSAEFEW
jgi:hypothetical protein